jgi:phosphoglycolate phosphatase-like HAD superfamily hydrolase
VSSIPQLICCDFDGVVCDSAGETATTGWRGVAALWPDRVSGAPDAAFLARFRRLRPVIETGYESIFLARLILDGVADAAILADFPVRCRTAMAAASLDRPAAIALFSRLRDEWLRDDAESWLATHAFYPGVPAALGALQAAGHAVRIVTTKQHAYTAALCARAGLRLADEAIHGLETGPKPAVLARLLAAPELAGRPAHFLEDRLPTLEQVAAVPALAAVRLYLCTWGYTTAAEVARVAALPRITALDLDAFHRLFRPVTWSSHDHHP